MASTHTLVAMFESDKATLKKELAELILPRHGKKQKVRIFFLTVFLCLISININAQLSNEAKKSLYEQDLQQLKRIYLYSSENQKKLIEDAMCNSLVNWENFTYEQLLDVKSSEVNNFQDILKQQAIIKEQQIISDVIDLDAELIDLYLSHFPKRTEVVNSYLSNVLFPKLDSLPYSQVVYLYRNLSMCNKELLETNLRKRDREIIVMVKSKLDDYCKIEASYKDRLVLILQIGAWQYLNNRFQGVASAYSKIGIVSDSSQDIANQFKGIVHAYLTSEDFAQQLKTEVDIYNNAVNKARSEYAKMANIEGYPLSDLTVPDIGNFSYIDNYEILNLIPKARLDFVQSRDLVDGIGSIASWLVGPFWSTVGEGLFDMYAVSVLADDEINARKELMKDVYSQLEEITSQYTVVLSLKISEQIENNQLKFKSYVQNYK